MDLSKYDNSDYNTGASTLKLCLWYFLGHYLVSSRLILCSKFKCSVLSLFGAKIGQNIVIKPGVKIKFPWRLTIGSNTWIGEDVWIDNIDQVEIGDNVCISQGAYLCTGSHDWKKPSFDLITKPIVIEDGCWVAAKAVIAPGVRLNKGSVLTIASVATSDLESNKVYSGSPAVYVKDR